MFHGPSSVLLFLLCMFCINALLIFKWRTGGYLSIISLVSPLSIFPSSVLWVESLQTAMMWVFCVIPTSSQTLPLFRFIPPFSVDLFPQVYVCKSCRTVSALISAMHHSYFCRMHISLHACI